MDLRSSWERLVTLHRSRQNSLASANADKEIEEERRLAYVGITRTERRLYLTRALARTCWGRPEYHAQSRFLAEVTASLIEWRRDQNAAAAVASASQRLARRPGVRSPRNSTRLGEPRR
jgi:DNA helicase-2/ATP-dependent DNA helicase PcrA